MSQTLTNNVWSTQKVESLRKEHKTNGVIPDKNPFFKRILEKKKGKLVWEYTKNEIFNIAKCQSNILEFVKFCKVKTEEGIRNIKLRPYQILVLKKIQENNFFIYLASRQIGKSIIIAIFMVWLTTFFPDMNCLLGSENQGKAKDLKAKIDVITDNMPFYMQNGVNYHSTVRTIYDNGSSINSEATTENFGVSGSYNMIYMDEFALLEPHLQEKIMIHVIPTLDSFGKTGRFIITTTPRGKNNKFYYLWNDAVEGKNKFGTMITKWYEVEGRDETWRLEREQIMGVEGFNQEYELSFDADSTLMFGSAEQKTLSKCVREYLSMDEMSKEILLNYVMPDRKNNISVKVKRDLELNEVEGVSYEMFKPNNSKVEIYQDLIKILKGYDINNFTDNDRQFVASVDLAEGVGKDYTVFNIFEIIPMTQEEIMNQVIFIDESSFFKLKQVGVIRSNNLGVEDFAKFCYHFLNGSGNYENYRLVIEQNFEGNLFMKTLFEFDIENNQLDPSSMVVEFPWNMVFEDAITFKTGIVQNNKSKEKGCKIAATKITQNKLIINEENTVIEAQGFGRDKRGNYKGTTKNDNSSNAVMYNA